MLARVVVDDVRTQLIQARERLLDAVRDRILADESLLSETGPGEGWAPIHAVDLLGELRAVAAIEPMLRLLAGTDFMEIVHDRILVRMADIGAPVVEPALHAYANSADEDFRLSLAAVLARTGVRDERILALLVERLDADATEANHLVEYGDRRALTHLHRALDRCEVSTSPSAIANQELIELREAIEELGGVLTAGQLATMRRVDAQVEAVRAAVLRGLQQHATVALPAKRGRNQPCWCGSGRKYKTCHLRADEDALAS